MLVIFGTIASANDTYQAKLVVDTAIAPNTDEQAVFAEVARLADAARAQLAGAGLTVATAPEWDRIGAVRTVLYEPGPWNEGRPFAYDHTDPLGTKVENKLLATYLRTRRGNCVSMPILYAILLEELGVPVTLGQAPLHFFVVWERSDAEGGPVFLEATSGGDPARPVWYEQNSIIADQALANGLYLRPLTKPERDAAMRETLVQHLMAEGRYEEAIEEIDAVLEAHPAFAGMLLEKANAIYELLDERFVTRWPDANDVPEELRGELVALMTQNRELAERAYRMGFRDQPPPPEQARMKE